MQFPGYRFFSQILMELMQPKVCIIPGTRFGSDWFPQEAIVEAGISEIPLQRLNADGLIVQRGMRLGVGGDRLEPCKIDNVEIIQNEIPSVNAVAGNDSPEKSDDEPPTTVLSTLMLYNKKRLYGYGRKYLNIYVRYILILKRIFGPQLLLML